MNTRSILVFVVIAFVILIIKPFKYMDFESSRQSNFCRQEKRALGLSIDGKVLKKYIDSENHNYETIEVQTENGIRKTWFLVLEQGGVFKKIKIGDIITKEKGELKIAVNDASYDLNYNCNRSLKP